MCGGRAFFPLLHLCALLSGSAAFPLYRGALLPVGRQVAVNGRLRADCQKPTLSGRARMLALPASDGPRQSHAASLTAEGRCAREIARRSLFPLLVVPTWTLIASPAPSAAGHEFTFFREFESILRQCAPMIAEVRRAGGKMLYRSLSSVLGLGFS